MQVSSLEERFKEALTERFVVQREIGRGGMATVFLAEQRRPRRDVAIKVLEPELATGMARERFLREVEFSSQLTHPNIVPIFEAGEADGLLFYVMPYISGQTLRARLAREGALPTDEVFRIAEEVADALDYAHNKGVVHRDVKPENILLSNGHAVVADFGIARALCAACGDNLTVAGYPIGTPGYMSPEQGSGEEVDPRTDVYSLGAVVYEMITGQPPFSGRTMEAIIAARYTRPTPTLRDAGWTLSDAVDSAIQRSLNLDRENRFETTVEFLSALKGSHVHTFIPDTLEPGRGSGPQTAVVTKEKSVAVLPFTNLSADPENEYFSEGITEDIITQLSTITDLSVTSRTSVTKYRNTELTMSQIGAELGVTTILEGSVRKSGNRVRVVAQLIDAKTDKHLWAERYDRELTDIFDLQSEIAEHIADALETTLTADERARLAKKPTDNLEAYNLYLQGRFYWAKFTPTGIHRAIDFFNQAVELDESYALAHAGLADAYIILAATLGLLSPHDAMPRAREAALKAAELDPQLTEAYTSLGTVQSWFDWDWAAAEESLHKAMELDPESEKVLAMMGFHHSSQGRHEEALELARRAEQNCPLSVHASSTVGMHLYKARRYEEAVLHLVTKTLELDRSFPPAHIVLGWTYIRMGRFDEAVSAAKRAAALTNQASPRRAALASALAAAGRRKEAETILDQLLEERKGQYVSSLDIAIVTAYLGRTDEAFEWLDRAFDERSPWLNHLHGDPVWDPIRDDPRFDALATRVGLG